MVDEFKQSTTTSTTHVKKNFQVNTVHGGLKAWMDLYRPGCPGSYLKYAFSIYVAILWQLNRGIPSLSWRYVICIITRGLCSYNARLSNDGVMAIEVSYWRRREFPNYAQLHRGRIWHYCCAVQHVATETNDHFILTALSSLLCEMKTRHIDGDVFWADYPLPI